MLTTTQAQKGSLPISVFSKMVQVLDDYAIESVTLMDGYIKAYTKDYQNVTFRPRVREISKVLETGKAPTPVLEAYIEVQITGKPTEEIVVDQEAA